MKAYAKHWSRKMFLKTKLNNDITFDSHFFRIIKLAPIIRDSNYTGSLVPLDFTDAVFTDICLVQLLCTNSLYHAFSYNLATFLMGIWLIQIFSLHKKTREPRTGCMYLWGCFFLSTKRKFSWIIQIYNLKFSIAGLTD